MKKLLLVIDMQEGFCKKGNPLYVGDQCNSLIPVITKKIEEYNTSGQWIFLRETSTNWMIRSLRCFRRIAQEEHLKYQL